MAFLSQFVTDSSGIGAPETAFNLFRVPEIDERLRELNITSPVFYKILEMLPDEETSMQPRFNWAEDDIPARITAVNHGGGYSAVAVSIEVDDGTIFVQGSTFRTMTHNELIHVDSISGNILTITRGYQGSTAAIIDDDEVLLDLGYALGESGSAPDARHKIPEEKWNYIEMFSRTFEISELQNSTDMRYDVAKVSRETLEKAFNIRRDISEKLLWGLRAKGTNYNSEVVYQTNGFYALATSNAISTAKAGMTWEDLWTFEDAFTPTASSNRKVLLCGSGVYETLAKISYDKTTFSEYNEVLGVQVLRIVLPSGNEVDVVKDRYTFTSDTGQEDKGILIDTAHIKSKWMNEWGLKWKQNIQSNDAHVRKDEIYGAMGLKLVHPDVHGTITLT